MNTNSLARANTGTERRLTEVLARWMERLNSAIDAKPLASRHRMGAWEASASHCAQAALQSKRVRKTVE